MKLIIYGGDDLRRIEDRIGTEDYSYHFLIQAFTPVLARIGDVHFVRHLDEVEPIRAVCEISGESCVILSFVPPHKTTLFMRASLVPVFSWGFEDIPFEIWDGQPKHDWRMVLQLQGRAIVLSSHSATVVRAAMGPSFPCIAIPPPVFDRMVALRDRIGGRRATTQVLNLQAILIDSEAITFSPEMPIPPAPPVISFEKENVVPETDPQGPPGLESSRRAGRFLRILAKAAGRTQAAVPQTDTRQIDHGLPMRRGPTPAPPTCVTLRGVVYFTIVDPISSLKNWEDLLTAFTWGLRDVADATLVIKIVPSEPDDWWERCLRSLRKQPAFSCRVLLIHGFLNDAQMGQLLESCSYVVNCSSGEGCSLPLIEGMSVGRPAIAPDHTAMTDYIDPSNAFIVASHLEVASFPHDSRGSRRTMWHLPRWDSLRDAFRASYRLATDEPERWLTMANASMEAQKRWCGDEAVETKLRDFLGVQPADPSLVRWGRDLDTIPIETLGEHQDRSPC